MRNPDPAVPAALLFGVTVAGVTGLLGIFSSASLIALVLSVVFWLATRKKPWLWRSLGTARGLIVSFAPAAGFSTLLFLGRQTRLAVPAVPHGRGGLVVAGVAGLWLTNRLEQQMTYEQVHSQDCLRSWDGAPPARHELEGYGAIVAVAVVYACARSLALVPPVLSAEYMVGVVAAAVFGALWRAVGSRSTSYTAYENGLVIDGSWYVPASDIRGVERTESALVIETRSRLSSILGTTSTHDIWVSQPDDIREVPEIFERYRSISDSSSDDAEQQTGRETEKNI